MAQFNITANGTQSGFFLYQKKFNELTAIGTGTFGGGSLTLEFELSDGTFVALPDAAFTAPFSKKIALKAPSKVRFVLTGATTPDIELVLN